jgi:hypothetical protein
VGTISTAATTGEYVLAFGRENYVIVVGISANIIQEIDINDPTDPYIRRTFPLYGMELDSNLFMVNYDDYQDMLMVTVRDPNNVDKTQVILGY